MGFIISKNKLYFSGVKHDMLAKYTPGVPVNRFEFNKNIQKAKYFESKEAAQKVANVIGGRVWRSNKRKPRTMQDIIQLGGELSGYMHANHILAYQMAETLEIPTWAIVRLLKGHTDVTYKQVDIIQHYLDNVD